MSGNDLMWFIGCLFVLGVFTYIILLVGGTI